jgi:AraC-like DNA-binding protein
VSIHDPVAMPDRLDEQLYVTANYLLMMLPLLDDLGIKYESFFSTYAIDVQRLDDPRYRIRERACSGIWDHLAAVTGDETIGLKAGRFANLKTFQLLGQAMWFTSKPLVGLEIMLRYFRLVTDVGIFTLLKTESGYSLKAQIRSGIDLSDANADAFLSALITICRQLYGHNFSPSLVRTVRRPLNNPALHHRFFRCSVEFGCSTIELLFDRETMETASNDFSGLQYGVTGKVLEENLSLVDSDQFEFQVRVLIKQNLNTTEGLMPTVCQQLHMSERTVLRKLTQRGMNFRQMTSLCRQELALEYISHSQLSLTDITHILGFSSYHNFSRAFKRWTGKSPQAFRERLCPPH